MGDIAGAVESRFNGKTVIILVENNKDHTTRGKKR